MNDLTHPQRRSTGLGPVRQFTCSARLGLSEAIGPIYARLVHPLRRGKAGRRMEISAGSGVFLRQLLTASVLVIAIGLLVLLLRGMRAGLVARFQADLAESPTATQIILTGKGRRITRSAVDALRADPRIQVTIPLIQHRVLLCGPEKSDDESLVLLASAPDDPDLVRLHIGHDFSRLAGRGVVITSAFAATRGVSVGDPLTVWVRRAVDTRGTTETHPLELHIVEVIDSPDDARAYVDHHLASEITDFKLGQATTWAPALDLMVPPRYAAYVLFVRHDLTRDQQRVLSNAGLHAVPVDLSDPEASVYSDLITVEEQHARGLVPLRVYRLRQRLRDGTPVPFPANLHSYVLGKVEPLDGCVLPWNPPLGARCGDRTVELHGWSGPMRWLKRYLKRPIPFPRVDDAPWEVVSEDAGGPAHEAELTLQGSGTTLRLPIALTGEPGPEPVLVPAPLLAQLHLALDGRAELDTDRRLFLEARGEGSYGRVRIHTRNIFDVTTVHDELARSYFVESNHGRIREVLGYCQNLDHLVSVLTLVALLVAVLAVTFVFHDVAQRKRQTMATLRLLGLPPSGTVVILLTRAVLVALVAAGLLVVSGTLAALVLNLGRPGLVVLERRDFEVICLGILGVCLVGTILPARRLSRLDPMRVLNEGTQVA